MIISIELSTGVSLKSESVVDTNHAPVARWRVSTNVATVDARAEEQPSGRTTVNAAFVPVASVRFLTVLPPSAVSVSDTAILPPALPSDPGIGGCSVF